MAKKSSADNPPIIIANWKMNLFYPETHALIKALVKETKPMGNKAEIVLCPAFIYLKSAQELLANSNLRLGAQDVFWTTKGNYTSQISAEMLMELDCQYVIIGHSERRQYVKEDYEMIDRKTVAAVRHKLTPIVCVGETMAERQQGVEEVVIEDQVKKALRFIDPIFAHEKLIICYEPVWSISPGRPCQPDEAKEMAMVIRQSLINLYPLKVVENNFRIIYGGSVDENNVKDYVDMENLHGVLVGAASLTAEKFLNLIRKLL